MPIFPQFGENIEIKENEIEREINEVPIEILEEKGGVLLIFKAETKKEAGVLNKAIKEFFPDRTSSLSYVGDAKSMGSLGGHRWKLAGIAKEEARKDINLMKRKITQNIIDSFAEA